MNSRRRFISSASAAMAAIAAFRPVLAAGIELRVGAIFPLGGASLPVARENLGDVAEGARLGLLLAEEDLQQNAALFGDRLIVKVANAPGASAARAARRLIEIDRVNVLIGGFTEAETETLAEIAQETGTLFFNIGASADALRNPGCREFTFHIEASAAMYLDALADWFVRAGHRRWHLVHNGQAESLARLERARLSLARHWGAEIVAESVVASIDKIDTATVAIEESKPDVVLHLDDWLAQLDFLSRYEAAGLDYPVTGFPEAQTQTRRYFALAHHAAPHAGLAYRAALWEATLETYGARELNARHAARWGKPLEPSGWAAYQALKIAFEAAQRTGKTSGAVLADFLSGGSVHDVYKGIGVSFRAWDHQLRQSLFLVQLSASKERGDDVENLLARASLAGELPAIYMPGTEPIERLDQLGDIRLNDHC